MQNTTLDSSDGGLTDRPCAQRRRPIRSRTCDALFRLLSHCRSNLDQVQCQGDGNDAVLQLGSREKESVVVDVPDAGCSLERSADLREAAGELVQAASTGKNYGIGNFRELSLEGNEAVLPVSDHVNLLNGNTCEAAPKKAGELEILVETLTRDCDPETLKSDENACSILDVQMDESGTFPAGDNMFIDDFPEVLRTFMDMDVVVEPSNGGIEANGAGSVAENIHCDYEQKLKMKEKELEKLMCISSGPASSSHPNSNVEIEEGEISGDIGDGNSPTGSLSEDVILEGERPGHNLPSSVDYFDEVNGMCNDQAVGHSKHGLLDDQEGVDGKNANVRSGSEQKEYPSLIASSNTTEDIQDGDARKKKRKRPSLEQKARKKKKERMKRAQKNRESGVKRLKLLPVIKTKAKEICRHYQKGRCSEGDKCNFSHDTVPLTKSKPCCHFARNSCMKGDDCPYDHELSKYPCTNYATNGFCSRGANCLFSHQSSLLAPAVGSPELSVPQKSALGKGVSSIMSNISGTEAKFPSPLSNTGCGKKTDVGTSIHQKSADAKVPLSTPKLLSSTPPKEPCGVSYLRNKELFSGDRHKFRQNGLPLRPSDALCSSGKTVTENAVSTVDKLAETHVKVVPRLPRGINFLSFTKNSTNDLNPKVLSSMLPSSNQGKGKSVGTPTPSSAAATPTLHRTPPEGSVIKQGNSPKSNGVAPSNQLPQTIATSTELPSTSFCSPILMQKAIRSTLAFAADLEAPRSSLGRHTG